MTQDNCRSKALVAIRKAIQKIEDDPAGLAAVASSLETIASSAQNLTMPYLEESISIVREIKDIYYRAQALTFIAASLPEPRKMDVLREAFAAARGEISYSECWSEVEASYSASHGRGLRKDLLILAIESRNAGNKEQALALIIKNISKSQEGSLFARDVEDEYHKMAKSEGRTHINCFVCSRRRG